MKRTGLLVIIICLLGIIIGSFAFKDKLFRSSSVREEKNANGFAVVELFTSEGCSSCPPADKLVARILEADKDKPVYILSYHVDYWDRMGWKDKFSDAGYTERQQQYADWLHVSSVYTPQIVVNGKEQFVGSNKAALDKALFASLKDSTKYKLFIHESTSNQKINLTYETTAPKNNLLVINLVQKSAQSSVKAGENAGLELSHVQVVRKQVVQSLLNTNGTIALDLPNDFKVGEWELICFVQNSGKGAVLCAAKSEL